MKQLIILVTIVLNSLFGYPIDKNYFTYEEFVKIKSYFTDKEQGCAGIERFLHSSKDLNVSDEWYPDEDYDGDSRRLKELPYQKLCLLAGSTDVTFYAYVDLSKSGAEYIKNKNYWINQFPKDKKIVSIEFSSSNEITKKCYKTIAPYAVVYEKRDNGVFERHFEFNNIQDGYKSDYNCILRQLNIFKTNPRIGTITNVQNNTKKDVIVRDSFYEDGGQRDRIVIGQKVRILGSIGKYSYIYYNKKTKDACDPLNLAEGCNSGWVDTSFIDLEQSSKIKTLSFDDYKKSIQSFLPPKNDYEKKIVRNLPYAIRGYIFQDKKVQKFYESMNWYVADKNYRPDLLMLSESEQYWIDQWK